MKHIFLKQWISEIEDPGKSLEAIFLLPELLILQLKGKQQLCICLSRQNSFPFFSPEPIDTTQARLIWNRLKNAALQSLTLADNDRILSLALLHKDIYGEVNNFTLVVELMPPRPNVILLGNDSKIIDAIYKYSYADNPQRQVLPNLPYLPPRAAFSAEEVMEIPALPAGFGNWNAYFCAVYHKLTTDPEQADELRQLKTILSKEQKKLAKKLLLQKQDLATAEKADYWLACAEGLKPNLAKIKQGQTSFTTVNYFDPNLVGITIELLPDKSPRENLQLYVKKYHKAKNGLEIIKANISQTEAELSRVNSLLERLEKGEQVSIELKGKGSVKQLISAVEATDKLLNLRLGDEFQIVIGRKAKENDFISTQLGKAQDYWFHSRIYHGAHVLLRCFKKQTPTEELIELCCRLAAGYSKAKNSLNVPVDYTQIRFVRKPRKSAPGYVTYSNFKSVYASPLDIRQARELLCTK